MKGRQVRDSRIVKSTGETVRFSESKLRRSLQSSGADPEMVQTIVTALKEELYPGMTTREIHNRAFAMLRESKSSCASRYKLKQAIYELGPTGYPFEKFVSALLNHSGYNTTTNEIMPGACVSHEIDVVAQNDGILTPIECKFHSDAGRKCNVKVPLYIHSRFNDLAAGPRFAPGTGEYLDTAWVVTNTRFTSDALKYGLCAGLYLLSWNHPVKNSLKDRIDRFRLYPLTVSVLLSSREKHFLIQRGVVLCRQLLEAPHYMDHLGISKGRKNRILQEFNSLCPKKATH